MYFRLALMSFIDEAIITSISTTSDILDISKAWISRSQIIDQKIGGLSLFKLVINNFFTTDYITKLVCLLGQKE